MSVYSCMLSILCAMLDVWISGHATAGSVLPNVYRLCCFFLFKCSSFSSSRYNVYIILESSRFCLFHHLTHLTHFTISPTSPSHPSHSPHQLTHPSPCSRVHWCNSSRMNHDSRVPPSDTTSWWCRSSSLPASDRRRRWTVGWWSWWIRGTWRRTKEHPSCCTHNIRCTRPPGCNTRSVASNRWQTRKRSLPSPWWSTSHSCYSSPWWLRWSRYHRRWWVSHFSAQRRLCVRNRLGMSISEWGIPKRRSTLPCWHDTRLLGIACRSDSFHWRSSW